MARTLSALWRKRKSLQVSCTVISLLLATTNSSSYVLMLWTNFVDSWSTISSSRLRTLEVDCIIPHLLFLDLWWVWAICSLIPTKTELAKFTSSSHWRLSASMSNCKSLRHDSSSLPSQLALSKAIVNLFDQLDGSFYLRYWNKLGCSEQYLISWITKRGVVHFQGYICDNKCLQQWPSLLLSGSLVFIVLCLSMLRWGWAWFKQFTRQGHGHYLVPRNGIKIPDTSIHGVGRDSRLSRQPQRRQ